MEILRIKDVSFTYPDRKIKAIENINLTIKEGDFTVVFGESGCGKTTLLRLLKEEIAPHGIFDGEIICKTPSSDIGFIPQDPDSGIVTDKVWHEIALGLENLGLKRDEIRRRSAEMAGYFGISDWYHKDTSELSGGQKQILNLASVLVMQPKLILLDEPTAQLDPVAAGDFISTLRKINLETGITVIIVEHRLEEVLPIADNVIYMEDSKVFYAGTPKGVANAIKGRPMEDGLTAAAKIFNLIGGSGDCPITVKEGRDFLISSLCEYENNIPEYKPMEKSYGLDTAIDAKSLWFRYSKGQSDVLKEFDISVKTGECFVILGANGIGKTTALNVIAGVDKAYKGSLKILDKGIKDYKNSSLWRGTLSYLPQEPVSLFIKSTVREDFDFLLKAHGIKDLERQKKIDNIVKRLGISELIERNPFDLSGGEQQKCALAKLLLTEPKILLLDEPTKGLDAVSKSNLRHLLSELKIEGKTILVVTHDIEFAAKIADRCALFFDGRLISIGTPNEFFSSNYFYTTAASRISRGVFKKTVLCDEVAKVYLSIRTSRDGKKQEHK